MTTVHDDSVSMHIDQIHITSAQVGGLIEDQAPDLARHEVVGLDGGGTDNAIFRIGEHATARFPLRDANPARCRSELAGEATAVAEFHRACPFPSPEPLLVGDPGLGYPLPWLLQTWVDGRTATPTSHSDSFSVADDLATLVTALRQWPTRGRQFRGGGRGGNLADHDGWVHECIRRTEGSLDTAAMRRLWARFRALPRDDPDVMCHTDLIPGNVLITDDGRLAGVLDSGGFQAADPALDLVAAWHLLEHAPRERLRARLDCDDLQWERGKAWAFQQAAGAFWYYQHTNPPMATMGKTTLQRLTVDT